MLLSFGSISIWWIWVALVIIFSLIEIFTLGLVTVWFAIAALVMVFLSFLPIPLSIQILIFLVISAALLIFTRPLAVKKFKIGRVKTNVDSLVGKHALVTKKIGEFDRGEAKVNGQIWTACSENSTEIAEGAKCEILRTEGVRLIVKPLEEVSE
jgi:membrane protein implicated in regulation of membrane protease activity